MDILQKRTRIASRHKSHCRFFLSYFALHISSIHKPTYIHKGRIASVNLYIYILQHVNPLLDSDRKQTGSHGNESTRNDRGTVGSVSSGVCAAAVATQRRVKMYLQQQMNYNNRRAVFPTWSVPRVYKPDEV
jgi:hypothetical protein